MLLNRPEGVRIQDGLGHFSALSLPFPLTSVLDAFTGTNGTDLPAYSGNWSNVLFIDDLEIQSNAVTGTVAGGNANYWNVSNFGPACEAFFTITTKSADGEAMDVGLRLVEEASGLTIDGYLLIVIPAAGADEWGIYSLTDGAETLIGSSFTQEITNGDGMGLRAVGSDLTAYYRTGGVWSSLATRTDATYSAAGKIAIVMVGTTARLDDFGGGTI